MNGSDKISKQRADISSLLLRAFTGAHDAIVLTSSDRRILTANAAAAGLFGYRETELAGLTIRTLYATDEDWRRTGDVLQAAAPDPTGGRLAVTLRDRSGNTFDATVSISSIAGDGGDLRGAVERIEINDTTAKLAALAGDQTSADTIRLARGIAHDFNNVLAIIGGNIQLAAMKASDPSAQMFLGEAAQACQMGARLTHRLMRFAEDSHLVSEIVDLAEMLGRLCTLLSHVSGDAIRLEMNLDNGLPPVATDRSAFENAVLNLIYNARDAMPEGGVITVSAANIRITTEDRNVDFVRISVTDTGIGMTPRVVARAFDPFFSTKPLERGTGLGLASVNGFAKQSGGHATIDSISGIGTTVSIFLPAARSSS